MRSKRLSFGLFCIALIGALALAQSDDERESPPAPPSAEPEAQEDEGNDLQRSRDEDVFIPSEEIPADVEVTFPVDI